VAAKNIFDDKALYLQGFLLLSVFGFFGSTFAPFFARRVGVRNCCALYLLLVAFSEVTFAVAVEQAAPSPWGSRAGFAVLGFANGGELVIVQLLLSPRVGGERRGTANGVIDSCGTLARIITPPLTAALYRSGFISMAWKRTGVLPCLAVVSLFFLAPGPEPGATTKPRSSVDDTKLDFGPELELGTTPLCGR